MKPYQTSTQLSNKAKVLKKSGQTDEYGNPLYDVVGVFWCAVKDRIGGETLVNSQNKKVSTARATFTMRASAITEAINPTMLIEWRNYRFDILSGAVFSDDRNFVSFECERKF